MLRASSQPVEESCVYGNSTSGMKLCVFATQTVIVLASGYVHANYSYSSHCLNRGISDTELSCREFKLSDDMFAQDSIELLKQSGIDFAKMEARGIDVSNFGELLMSSGIVLNEDVSHFQHSSSNQPCPLQIAAEV